MNGNPINPQGMGFFPGNPHMNIVQGGPGQGQGMPSVGVGLDQGLGQGGPLHYQAKGRGFVLSY